MPSLFSQTMKELFLASGMSQTELAERTGLTQSYISRLLTGKAPPPAPESLKKICQVLEDNGELERLAFLERTPERVLQIFEELEESDRKLLERFDLFLQENPEVYRTYKHIVPQARREFLRVGGEGDIGKFLYRVELAQNLSESLPTMRRIPDRIVEYFQKHPEERHHYCLEVIRKAAFDIGARAGNYDIGKALKRFQEEEEALDKALAVLQQKEYRQTLVKFIQFLYQDLVQRQLILEANHQ